jgi:hypothetical protein
MKLLHGLTALILAAGLARADVVIVQKVDGAGQSGQMTVTVGTDKVRTDISPQVSTITDTTTGQVTTLMHDQKVYMIISADAEKAMCDQMSKTMQQSGVSPSASPAPPKATGKTDKINGYNAAEYTFNNGIIKASYWVSTEFPNAKMVSDALARFSKGSLADMTKAFTPDLSSLPGVPVKTEMEFNGQKMTTELVSATEQQVDPSIYQVPAAYTEVKMAPPTPQP